MHRASFYEFFKHPLLQTVLRADYKMRDWITNLSWSAWKRSQSGVNILQGQFGIVAATSRPKSTPRGLTLSKATGANKSPSPAIPPSIKRPSTSSTCPHHNEPLHSANDRQRDRCSTAAIDPVCRAQWRPPIITAARSSITPSPAAKG